MRFCRKKIYVGYSQDTTRSEVFLSAAVPTEVSHGAQYFACTGPFRTRRAAELTVDRLGVGELVPRKGIFPFNARTFPNPHIYCVADAERIAKYLEENPR